MATPLQDDIRRPTPMNIPADVISNAVKIAKGKPKPRPGNPVAVPTTPAPPRPQAPVSGIPAPAAPAEPRPARPPVRMW